MISYGPGLASDEYTGDLQNAASINTKPGSSHNEDSIKPFAFLKYGNIFFLYPSSKILFDNLWFLIKLFNK